MASLDHFDANVHCHGAHRQHDDARLTPKCVSMVDNNNQSRDDLGTRSSNLFASKAVTPERCRSVLEQILRPVAAERSGQIADLLVTHTGSLRGTLTAQPSRLASLLSSDVAIYDHLRSVAAAFEHCLRSRIAPSSFAISLDEIVEFLKFEIGFKPCEIFYVLYFNSKSELIHDGPLAHGNVTSCAVSARSVVQCALDVGAAFVILAHNHPSGDPKPSRADRILTRDIKYACGVLQIGVFDHLVITQSDYVSMRAENLV